MSDEATTARHTEADVRALIREIVQELAPEPEGAPAGEDAHLVDQLGFHSLALLELAFTLEDEFELPPIDEETARRIRTVRDVEQHVLDGLSEQGRLAAAA